MKDLSKKLLESIKERPNMDTRAIINICAKVLSVPKQKICGHLSWLKRSGQISINTKIPDKYSEAK